MIDYDKMLHREVKPVDEESLSKIEEIPFHKDMYYKNINRFLAAPTIKDLVGYKKYEDGSGVASAYTRMDGVTKEMIHFFYIWLSLDPKRYPLWLPGVHEKAGNLSEKEKAQLLNKKIPLHERKWGTISRMKNDSGMPSWFEKFLGLFGKKYGGVTIQHKRPIEIGIDESIFEEDDLKSFVCSVVYKANLDYPITVLHYLKEDETGLDVHSRMWHGVQFNGKRFVRVGKKVSVKELSKSLKLCLEEQASLSGIVKEIYESETKIKK